MKFVCFKCENTIDENNTIVKGKLFFCNKCYGKIKKSQEGWKKIDDAGFWKVIRSKELREIHKSLLPR